jgi:iron complex outermembrane receptor protein
MKSQMFGKYRFLAATALAVVGYAAPGAAFAQSAPSSQNGAEPAQAESSANTGLEDIVVTARRREENLQTAPVAVTAFSAERLDELRPTSIFALNALAPNLVVAPAVGASSGSNIYIRGIGQSDPSPYLDAANAMYINGVLRARTSASLSELGDIERVEVLRGPQGTLFGRNTTGGAVSIYTPKPTSDTNGLVSVGLGSDGERMARVTLNSGELGNTGLKVKGNYFYRTINGVARNPLADPDQWPGAARNEGVDIRVAGDYGVFSFDYEFDYTWNRGDAYSDQVVFFVSPTLFNYFNASASLGGDAFVVAPDRLESMPIDRTEGQHAEVGGHALTLNFDFGDKFSVKSITAYRWDKEYRPFNTASQPRLLGRVANAAAPGGFVIEEVTPLQTPVRTLDENQFSQELQFLGKLGDFDYVAGLFYFRERFSEENINWNTQLLANGLGQQRYARRLYDYGTDSFAGFAQVSWRPNQGPFELTGGLRYTWDEKKIDDYAFLNGVQNRHFVGKDSFKNLSGVLSASYQVDDNAMLYVRGATGYKAGGFVPGSAFQAFLPEKVKSIEGGIKSELFDRHLRLNVAAFYTKYTDLQVTSRVTDAVTGNRVSTLTNAGSASYYGAEVEMNAILGAGFSIDGTLGYVRPKYDEYPFFDGVNDLNVANEATFPLTSKLTTDAGIRYTSPDLGVGVFTARINYSYQSGRYFYPLTRNSPNNERLRAEGQGFVNARFTLRDIPLGSGVGVSSLRVEAYVDNIFDKDRYLFGIDSTNYGSKVWGRGRQGGIELTVGF